MRTQLAPLIVVKQEFPDFRLDSNGNISNGNDEENNNFTALIKSENDCNNNNNHHHHSEDIINSIAVKKCKDKNQSLFIVVAKLTD